MKFGLALSCFLLILNVAGVRAQDVSVDFDGSSDFPRFKTYSWTNGIPAGNPLIDRQIRSGVEAHLAAKGLRRVEEGGDLSVMYFAVVDRETEVAAGRWLSTGDWSRQIKSGIHVRSQSWDVEVGTLIVCLSDASDKSLLWRGTAKTTLDRRSRNRKYPPAKSAG